MFMVRYLFLQMSENKNTEYLPDTYYMNNECANVRKFMKITSNPTNAKSAEIQETNFLKE